MSIITIILKGKLKTSVSFRAISEIFNIFAFCLNLGVRKPTYTTVISWVQKVGYYELTKPKEKADDWVIILDHSIDIGRDKIFMIYGIRESNIDFTRPLRYQDLVPLLEISKEKWNGEIIRDYLVELKNELGNIIYAVADYGSDIKKGLRLAGIKHVHDITHAIALILEKIYKNDEIFRQFKEELTKMIKELLQTELVYIIPPKQRKKARYQNIKTIIDWAIKILKCLRSKKLDKEIREKIKWIKRYEKLIKEFALINEAICEIEKIVKSNGLSKRTIMKCNKILKKLSKGKCKIIGKKIKEYFNEKKLLLPEKEIILCTSDILESSFGKYKNYISINSMAGITNLALCMAAFTSSLNESDIKQALESTTVNDIKDWTEKNIGKTLLQKRRNFFAKAVA